MQQRQVKAPFPRIYLDTNVLLSAILESAPKWMKKNNPNPKKLKCIQSSHEIYRHSALLTVRTSPYAIAEFIAKGRTQNFGKKSFDEMVKIVNSKIFPNCEVMPANLPFKQIPKIDKKFAKHWLLFEFKAKGDAVDERGNPLGIMDLGILVDLQGHPIHTWGGGVPIGTDPLKFKPRLATAHEFSYSAPAFEILLFYKATELAISLNIHLSDAIHILYAKEETEFFVTNDEDFLKRFSNDPNFRKITGLRPISSQELVDMLKKMHLF